jgi:hypothetical protein
MAHRHTREEKLASIIYNTFKVKKRDYAFVEG